MQRSTHTSWSTWPAWLIAGCCLLLAGSAGMPAQETPRESFDETFDDTPDEAPEESPDEAPSKVSPRPRTTTARLEPGSLLLELRDEAFLKSLNFTEKQQEQLEALRSEFRDAFQASISEDERQQQYDELDRQAVELLTELQQPLWEKRKAQALAKAQAEVKKVPEPGRPAPAGAKSVASFGASDDTDLPERFGDDPRLSFNFQYAPWTEVLELFAKASDLTLDLTDTPPGTFSYRDSRSYTSTQALDVLNGYLLPRGFILVRRDRFLVSLSTAGGIPPNLAPQVSLEELPLRGKNELVSVVIPARGLQADQVVEEIRQLLGPQGRASALKNTNSIVVTDIGSHVRRVYALLTDDSSGGNKETAFKAIPLKHISASEAERMIRRLFGLNTSATSSAQPAQNWWQQQQPQQNWGGWGGRDRRGDRGDRGDRGGNGGEQGQPQFAAPVAQPMPQPTSGGSQFSNKIQIAADNRTNHLLVTASSSLISVVEETVMAIDTDVDASGAPVRNVDMPMTLKIYSVPSGDVDNIAQTVNMIVPGVLLGHDAKLGKLHIQATADEHKQVAELIAELGGEGTNTVAVIHLQKMEPVSLANTLNSLFAKEGARAPTVEADPLGRRLIVRGTADQLLQLKAILTGLGEGDGSPRDRTNRGTVRSLALGGRDPDELLPLLKDAWSASRPNPIRIVVPSRPKPIRERSVPGAGSRPSGEDGPLSEDLSPRSPVIRSASLRSESATPDDEESAKSESEDARSDDEETTKKSGSPISVEVLGDQMILSSPDEAALDRLEELYERLSAAIPARTKWHVFYLRSADATDASQMIEKLFPQSNVTATTASTGGLLDSVAGGFSSIGRGLMNVSGLNQTLSGAQTLRIVTDVRANALFVTGPGDQVAEVEQILEVLDASELPDSLRDRMPRTIAVEHADVEEVAEVVETVFKDAMTPENPLMGGGGRGGGGGINPLMMLMGGGGQAASGRRQPGVQLTVGIDRRTNHLIVSCNDSLFQQIESLVQGIDERAKKSRQTVRVVKLDQADPTLVQQTLGSLMPKVTVGTTRRTRRPTAGSTSTTPPATANPPANTPGASSGDPVRDAIMQRIMQDRSGGGSGGGGGSGRGGRGGRGGGFGGN